MKRIRLEDRVALGLGRACRGSTARSVECSTCPRPRATRLVADLDGRRPTGPLRANTSAMPAPMVPSPTTPTSFSSLATLPSPPRSVIVGSLSPRPSARPVWGYRPVTQPRADGRAADHLRHARALGGPRGRARRAAGTAAPAPHAPDPEAYRSSIVHRGVRARRADGPAGPPPPRPPTRAGDVEPDDHDRRAGRGRRPGAPTSGDRSARATCGVPERLAEQRR